MARTGWTEDDYRVNLKRLNRDHRSYTWSSYENKSIMKYFFEVDELKKGKQSACYSEENYEPSMRDFEGLRTLIPRRHDPCRESAAGQFSLNRE